MELTSTSIGQSQDVLAYPFAEILSELQFSMDIT